MCGIDRTVQRGYCNMPSDLYVARAALHEWEEPIISGTRGSGTIFFSGCSLGCTFCQNNDISNGGFGKFISDERLVEIMLELQLNGAHNINFVTPTHYTPTIRCAIVKARAKGLTIPIVYNTGSYDAVETIKSLSGLVDVYLPDFKYYLSKTARSLSNAENYPTVAREAIAEMVSQTGRAELDVSGMIIRGTIVRILLLPGHVAEAKLSLKYLFDTYGDDIYISLMSQYTPMKNMLPQLNRTVTRDEYRQLVEYAESIGVKNAFIQEHDAANKVFIPKFDGTGVI